MLEFVRFLKTLLTFYFRRTEEMATPVQVRACKVFSIFSLVLTTFYNKKVTLKMSRHNMISEFVFVLKSLITFYFRRRRMPHEHSQL